MSMALYFLGILCFSSNEGEWTVKLENLSRFTWQVSSLVVTPEEQTYFLDGKEHLIFQLNDQGVEVNVFGKKGQGPGEFERAWKLEYLPAAERLLLFDHGQRKLVEFDRDGQYIETRKLEFELVLGNPIFMSQDLAVLMKAANPFADELGQGARFLLFDFNKKSETLLLKNDVTKHGDPIVSESSDGRKNVINLPWTPRSLIAVSPNRDVLFMGSTIEVNFTVYDVAKGIVSGRIEDMDFPVSPLTVADLEYLDQIFGQREKSLKDYDPPATKPPTGMVLCDSDNRLWVQINHDLLAKNASWMVYESTGKRCGRVCLPKFHFLEHATQTHVWCVVRDPDDDEQVLIKKMAYHLE